MRLLVSSLLLVAVSVSAQEKGGKKGGPLPPPKNLKLLSPDSDIRGIMVAFMRSLGVEQCTYCHVQGDFASDENPKKATALMMIGMAREINAKFPDGKQHVNCYTCHRGDITPKMELPAQ